MVMLNGGTYLKADMVKPEGTMVKFVTEGGWQDSKWTKEDGTPQKQFVIDVELGTEKYQYRMNKTSRDNMCAAYGNDTAGWVGKEALLLTMLVMVAGKQKHSIVANQPQVVEDI